MRLPFIRKISADFRRRTRLSAAGELFYAETLEYVRKLKEAGIEADADVYPSDMHAFDMLDPESAVSQAAIRTFEDKFEKALAAIRREEVTQ